jgi:hypothetical protein
MIDRLRSLMERSPDAALRALALACGALALALALGAYAYGKLHRFHHWVPEVIEYENVKVAAALSQAAYGFRPSYVAPTQVYEALRRGGMTIHPEYLELIDKSFPANLSDVELLNKALRDASQLGKLEHGNQIMTHIKPVEPIDLGMVDFYAYAFRLFGIKIQSFYSFYYLLHFATIALFALAYWRSAAAMAGMLAIVGCHLFAQAFLVGGVPPEHVFGVATPYSYRFVTVLGVLSAFHIALALLWPPRPGVASVIALVGQTVLLFFVWTMRRSALWEVFWVGSILAGLLGLILLWRFGLLRRWSSAPDLPVLMRRLLSWPAMAFVSLFIVLGAVQNARIDPAYRFTDEWLSHHMVWHSLFVGLSAHPSWNRKFGKTYSDKEGVPQLGDALPIAAAEKWLQERYGISPEYIRSPIYGYKYRTLERVLQEAFVDFAKQNPRFVLELQLVHKPLLAVKNYVAWNARTFIAQPVWVLALLLAGFLLFMAACAAAGWANDGQALPIARLLAVGAALAVLPAVIVFPSYSTMADQAMMLNAAVLGWVGLGSANAAHRYRNRMVEESPGGRAPYYFALSRMAMVVLLFAALYELFFLHSRAREQTAASATTVKGGADKTAPTKAVASPLDPRVIWQAEPNPPTRKSGATVNRQEQVYTSVPQIFLVMPKPDALPRIGHGHAIMGGNLRPAALGNLIRVRATCDVKAEEQANDFVMALYRNYAQAPVRAAIAPVDAGKTARITLVYEESVRRIALHDFGVRVGVGREGKLTLNPRARGCSLLVEEIAAKPG